MTRRSPDYLLQGLPIAAADFDAVQAVLLPVWRGRTDVLRPMHERRGDDPVDLAVSTPDLALIRVDQRESAALLERVLTRFDERGETVRLTAPPEVLAARRCEHAVREAQLGVDIDQLRSEHTELARRCEQLASARPEGRPTGFWSRLFGRRPSPGQNGAEIELARQRLSALDAGLTAREAARTEVRRRTAQLAGATGEDPADVLIAWNATDMTGAEFLAAAAGAQRWVLFGLVGTDGAPPGGNAFDHLWSIMTGTPWAREGERLRCRLRPIATEERPRLVVEPLADAADIELRFRQDDDAVPELVEITFPATTTLAAAKEFIAHELGEWPIDLEAADLEWTESVDRVVACCGCQSQHTRVENGPAAGVNELIADRPAKNGPLPWYTCGFTFDRAAGWDRGRAEEWLARLPGDRARARTLQVSGPSTNQV